MALVIALPIIGAALTHIPTIGAQLNAVALNLQLAMAGALATAIAIRLYHLVMDGVMGLPVRSRRNDQPPPQDRLRSFQFRLRRTRGGAFFVPQTSAALTRPLARAGSIEAPSRSFTSAMTRPMSFIDDAPVSATISRIFASASASLSCCGQEALDHGDLGFLGGGAVLAAVLAVDVGRFAALLDHFLQHFGDERVVVLGRAAGARLDVAVLDRRLDQAKRAGRFLVAALHRGDRSRP